MNSTLITQSPYVVILFIVAFFDVMLILKKISEYFLVHFRNSERYFLRKGTDAILFWGIFSVFIGVIGQFHGIHNKLSGLIMLEEINISSFMEVFRISFIPTLIGITTLLISLAFWIILRMRFSDTVHKNFR